MGKLISLVLLHAFAMAADSDDNASPIISQTNRANFSLADEACYRLPGLVLEMGSDKPLDNFAVCFEPNADEQVISRALLPLAHHYLNTNHWLIGGASVCSSGLISAQVTVFGPLEMSFEASSVYVKTISECNAQGCRYELRFLVTADSACSN